MNQENKKTTVSIIGTCVLRDLFRFHDDNDGDYKVDQFIQSISPISAVCKSMLLKEIDINSDDVKPIFSDISNFYKRVYTQDICKTPFNYLKEKISDYLVIDSATMRYDLEFTPPL